MGKKTNDNPNLIYEYGLLAPIENEKELREEIRRAHKFKNGYIALRKEMYASLKALFLEMAGEEYREIVAKIAPLEKEKKQLQDEIKEIKKELRQKRVNAPKQRARIKEINLLLKPLMGDKKVISDRVTKDPYYQTRKKSIEKDYKKTKRNEYNCAHNDIYSGTRNLITNSSNQGGHKIRFKRWDGSAHLRIQVQLVEETEENKGQQKTIPLTQEILFGCKHTLVRVEPVSEGAWHPSVPRGDRRRLSRTVLSFRIGNLNKEGKPDPNGKTPLWAKFPMIMHRPLPEGAIIKEVHLLCEKVANREKWKVQFMLEIPPIPRRIDGPVLAIDVGWRQHPEGLLVGTCYDGTSYEKKILLSEIIDKMNHSDETLKSKRKIDFNETLDEFKTWLKEQKNLPEWLKERTSHIHLWKSQAQLASLVLQWLNTPESDRPENGDDMLDYLEEWRKYDLRDWQEEADNRKKAARWRRETYRIWAKDLAEKYSAVVFENIKISALAKRCNPEVEYDSQNQTARRQRVLASPGMLRLIIMTKFKSMGRRAITVPAAYSTRTCNCCGHRNKPFKNPGAKNQTCEKCGETWDRDENAARNLHQWGLEALAKPEEPEKEENDVENADLDDFDDDLAA